MQRYICELFVSNYSIYYKSAFCPLENFTINTIAANAKSICIDPPNVYEFICPNNQSANRTNIIIQVMFLLSYKFLTFIPYAGKPEISFSLTLKNLFLSETL